MLYFFDTSALQHRYINGPKSRSIRRTISDSRNECYIADITILEIASTFGRHCRSNYLSRKDFLQFDKKFWNDVKSGILKLYEPGKLEYLKAHYLLEYAGVGLKRRLSSSDALIAACCLELGINRSTKVRFCLEDWNLYDVTRNVSYYKSVVDFKFIGRHR